MITLLRHLLAIAVLPFTVLVLVPYWIAERYGVAPALGHSVGPVFLQVVGLALLGLGLAGSSIATAAARRKPSNRFSISE